MDNFVVNILKFSDTLNMLEFVFEPKLVEQLVDWSLLTQEILSSYPTFVVHFKWNVPYWNVETKTRGADVKT